MNIDFSSLFNNFNVNNIWQVILIGVVIMVAFAGSINQFSASRVEVLLMRKNDLLKRVSMKLLLLFILFAGTNCLLILDDSFILMEIVLLVLCAIICIISLCREKFIIKKNHPISRKWREDMKLVSIIILGPFFAQIYSNILGIESKSCAILAAIIEVSVIILSFPQIINHTSDILLELNDSKEWYIYQNVNDDFLLYGNDMDINKADQIRMISIETIIEKDYLLKRK